MLQKLIRPRVSAVVAPIVAALAVTSTFMTPAQTFALAATAPTASNMVAAQASCASLTSVSLPNTTINSAVNAPSGQIPPPLPGFPPRPSSRHAASTRQSPLLVRAITLASTCGCR